ncbi:DUF4113 domain-containing protein [Shewanella sp. NFH-SH190041]|uniref:DUF4113 domain-containing protein n=1 Tax=Shewanella sp. NFH-SH190041 TaxID=2950245 RepID=UPI0021C40306|nr:DUF4113 domain-containing protein [Shewanella sp. NFH-SH190041]
MTEKQRDLLRCRVISAFMMQRHGVPAKHWDEARADKKQIFSTRSMGECITDLESLQQALSKHASIAAQKARAQGSACKTLICFAGNSPFDGQPYYRKTLHQFPVATADSTILSQTVTRLAKDLFRPGIRFYKIGVGLIELHNSRHSQDDLFSPDPSKYQLMNALDGLNRKYGTDTLFIAAQGIEQKWGMKRDMLSPQYITRWKDLPKVKC